MTKAEIKAELAKRVKSLGKSIDALKSQKRELERTVVQHVDLDAQIAGLESDRDALASLHDSIEEDKPAAEAKTAATPAK